jgi:hypothetical protein
LSCDLFSYNVAFSFSIGQKGYTMGNPRVRGKIPHAEWPKIAQRVANGESLAAIAREYECTPPAIRYIAQRMSRQATGEPRATERYGNARRFEVTPPQTRAAGAFSSQRTRGQAPTSGEVWSRVNADIANFLTAVDTFSTADSPQSRTVLLDATDRLLRASARARMELERTFEQKLVNHPETASRRRRKTG